MTTFINPDEFRKEIHSMIKNLEAQHYAALNAWREVDKQMKALTEEYHKKRKEANMSEQRRAALLDLLSVIDRFERR